MKLEHLTGIFSPDSKNWDKHQLLSIVMDGEGYIKGVFTDKTRASELHTQLKLSTKIIKMCREYTAEEQFSAYCTKANMLVDSGMF